MGNKDKLDEYLDGTTCSSCEIGDYIQENYLDSLGNDATCHYCYKK